MLSLVYLHACLFRTSEDLSATLVHAFLCHFELKILWRKKCLSKLKVNGVDNTLRITEV